jgi:valyl-tRNA synthetase
MNADFPEPIGCLDDPGAIRGAEKEMALVMEVITGIRNIRGEMNIAPSAKLAVAVASEQSELRRTIQNHQDLILNLARLESFTVQENEQRSETAATAIISNATVLVELKGVVDFARETQRLEKEIGKLSKELTAIGKKLGNQGFLAKAPPQVVADVREKQAKLTEKQGKLAQTLEKVKAFV